jgi:hypothetical protein
MTSGGTGTPYATSLQRSRSSILPHLTFPAHQPDSARTCIRMSSWRVWRSARRRQRGPANPDGWQLDTQRGATFTGSSPKGRNFVARRYDMCHD